MKTGKLPVLQFKRLDEWLESNPGAASDEISVVQTKVKEVLAPIFPKVHQGSKTHENDNGNGI